MKRYALAIGVLARLSALVACSQPEERAQPTPTVLNNVIAEPSPLGTDNQVETASPVDCRGGTSNGGGMFDRLTASLGPRRYQFISVLFTNPDRAQRPPQAQRLEP